MEALLIVPGKHEVCPQHESGIPSLERMQEGECLLNLGVSVRHSPQGGVLRTNLIHGYIHGERGSREGSKHAFHHRCSLLGINPAGGQIEEPWVVVPGNQSHDVRQVAAQCRFTASDGEPHRRPPETHQHALPFPETQLVGRELWPVLVDSPHIACLAAGIALVRQRERHIHRQSKRIADTIGKRVGENPVSNAEILPQHPSCNKRFT